MANLEGRASDVMSPVVAEPIHCNDIHISDGSSIKPVLLW